ncbi:MAG: hypothetical protein OSB76_16410 [Alphaproteobacteria bacterium]|nr:hypothetical protein [Alphaproteobacteria bacterium]
MAAMLFAAAGLSGVLAAAQGVLLQAPICGPGGTELPTDPGPGAQSHNDHCKIFPCGGLFVAGLRADNGLTVTAFCSSGYVVAVMQAEIIPFRAELVPVNGRAPPFQS